VVRTFCRTCGTPLTWQRSGKPDRLDIMTCSLDDPDKLPPAYRVWTVTSRHGRSSAMACRASQRRAQQADGCA
jgi:hypothetical protein